MFIEILGLLFGIAYILCMVKEKRAAWPLGLLAVSLYAFSCFQSQLYGEFSLQIAYAILAIYGWYTWGKNTHNNLNVSKLSNFQYIISMFSGIAMSLFAFYLLQALDGSLPLLDAITNGFAITATVLAARKKLENWIFWIPINAITIYMMLIKGMPFYTVLYLGYLLFAILGYFQWRKSLFINSMTTNS